MFLMMRIVPALAVCLCRTAVGQLVGQMKEEQPPPMQVAHCTKKDGCKAQLANATMDANWRWVHSQTCSGTGAQQQCQTGGNCYTNGAWDQMVCKDPKTCAKKCALEGVTAQDYKGTYGVSTVPGGLQLKFVSMGAGGMNVGSRLYLMDSEETYLRFRLKNREFTFDVDVSNLPCGLNGAVYFSEMEIDGGKGGSNAAGAKYGTGYCDAQCPHDIKFMNGDANVLDWNSTATIGHYGACCVEMDIWEANKRGTAFTPHPCTTKGTYICEGAECGDIAKKERYKGVCDKDGCDYNSYRMGVKDFFGEGPDFAVDSSKPVTIVTQWLTTDGTDAGDLSEIRRFYIQGGKIIKNSNADILGSDFVGNSITDEFCSAQKKAFGDPDDFTKKGGLKVMGEALDRGMVLVLSLWDDNLASMLWLDSAMGKGGIKKPGVLRGPCPPDSGKPAEVRAKVPQSSVKYMNILYGEIGSTFNKDGSPMKVAPAPAMPASLPSASQPSTPAGTPAQPASPAVQPVQPPAQPPAQPASPASGAGTCAPAYQQCGGGGVYTGPKCCQPGCDCVERGGGYKQCVPPVGKYMCWSDAQQTPAQASQQQPAATPAPTPAPTTPSPTTPAPMPVPAPMPTPPPVALQPRAAPTPQKGIAPSGAGEFCCFAYENVNNKCGSCHPTGVIGPDKGWCGQSRENCLSCTKEAAWCEASSPQGMRKYVEGVLHEASLQIRHFRKSTIGLLAITGLIALFAGTFVVQKVKKERARSSTPRKPASQRYSALSDDEQGLHNPGPGAAVLPASDFGA